MKSETKCPLSKLYRAPVQEFLPMHEDATAMLGEKCNPLGEAGKREKVSPHMDTVKLGHIPPSSTTESRKRKQGHKILMTSLASQARKPAGLKSKS